jgi:hypothetical protein
MTSHAFDMLQNQVQNQGDDIERLLIRVAQLESTITAPTSAQPKGEQNGI